MRIPIVPPCEKGRLGGISVLLAFCWFLAACGGPEPVQFSGRTMGTGYTVKAVGVPETIDAQTLQARIDAILAGINRRMSTYDQNSELSRFNRNPSTEWVAISDELALVIKEALRISRVSGGAFDPTVGPLVNLWGFGPEMKDDEVPSQEALDAARARVGYEKVELRAAPSALRKARGDIYLDLSAVAKGYAVDRVAAYLESLNIPDYMVEIGGELRAKGHNPRGEPWNIAIEKPVPGEQSIQRIVQLTGDGVATSGDYRNFFEKDGQRYSHAIDPHTGWPIHHRLASVTVIDPSCMHADALATTLLVLGPEAGFELAQRQDLAAFFIVIDHDGFVEKTTAKFNRYLVQKS